MNRKSRIASRRLERSLLSCALAGCMLLSAPAPAVGPGGTLPGCELPEEAGDDAAAGETGWLTGWLAGGLARWLTG